MSRRMPPVVCCHDEEGNETAMNTAWAVVTAAGFIWLGMVLAISFMEARLKFRAPGVTVPIGVGIGRLVFRALNTVEVVLAVVIVIAIILAPPPAGALAAVVAAIGALALQLVGIRALLNRRSRAVLAGDGQARRSRSHYGYVFLEVVKVIALLVGGILLLAA